MDISQPPASVLPNTSQEKNRKIYTGVAARLLKLLSGGATQEQAAQAVGVSAQLVSMYCSEADFQEQIVETMKVDIEKAIAIDQDCLDMEHEIVKNLKARLMFLPSMTTEQVLRLWRSVNGAAKRTNTMIPNKGIGSSTDGSGSSAGTVTLVIPTFIHNTFVLSPTKEIVGINDRELVTLDSKALNRMVIEQSKTENSPNQVPRQILEIEHERIKRPQAKPSDPWAEL